MVIVHARWVSWVHAGAVTVWPFLFVPLGAPLSDRLVKHENEHGRQQLWFVLLGALLGVLVGAMASLPLQPASAGVVAAGVLEGYVAGHLLWRWLYLVGVPFGLPVGWNPFRAWAERRAYRAEGRIESDITRTLRQAPYYLWWLR